MGEKRAGNGAKHRVRIEFLDDGNTVLQVVDFYAYTAEQARVLAIYLSRCIDSKDFRCTIQVLTDGGFVQGSSAPREVHRTKIAYDSLLAIRKAKATHRMDVIVVKNTVDEDSNMATSNVAFSLYFYSNVDIGTAFHMILKGLDRTYKLITCYQHEKSSQKWKEIAPMGFCDRDIANLVNRLSYIERIDLIEHITNVLHSHEE